MQASQHTLKQVCALAASKCSVKRGPCPGATYAPPLFGHEGWTVTFISSARGGAIIVVVVLTDKPLPQFFPNSDILNLQATRSAHNVRCEKLNFLIDAKLLLIKNIGHWISHKQFQLGPSSDFFGRTILTKTSSCKLTPLAFPLSHFSITLFCHFTPPSTLSY
ncbi:MAG: hypothetical protein UR99_C0026G0014 [Candidatus Moranbacteria bacterium GW2011_GWD2_36_12]|nr:MAG: hypothetical protein UR99_C0026G0014 [Candidatus Moranbacteria bacterium GW2011_GWD2_36_12]KKQ06524.1 MAG: hypothetical protein US16_C0015G0021 [Candidatus Moranbacteria bacterium GW2011_GWE2_36_40]